ncbi:MAG: acyltransferase [Muribaculaceae bacterium]|nr:acyltransferase [Muribaculaceae bacterium]
MLKQKLSLRQRLSHYINLFHSFYLKKMKGVDLGKNCQISRSAIIDRAHPTGVHIGNNTRVALEALIIAHDYSRGKEMWKDTYIGNNCVVGGRAIILPGVRLGDHVYVAAGSVVTKSFPDHCLIGGNPAKIIKTGIVISDKTQIQNPGIRFGDNS